MCAISFKGDARSLQWISNVMPPLAYKTQEYYTSKICEYCS